MILDKIMQLYYKKNECEAIKNELQFYLFDNDLICELYKLLHKRRKVNNGWDENAITTLLLDLLLEKLERLNIVENINIYKQNGNLEKYFGDIAFVLTFKQDNGNFFHGVSFMEAKRDYSEKNYCFYKFKKGQLDRIVSYTISSFYLFYSHTHFLPVINSFFLKNLIETLNIKENQLHMNDLDRFYTTLLTQIDRFLRGFDLDFSKNSVVIAEGNNLEVGKPKYIFHIEITREGLNPEPTPPLDNNPNPPFKPNCDYELIKIKEKEYEEDNNYHNNFNMEL